MGGRGARGLCADGWQVARPVRHQDGGIMARARRVTVERASRARARGGAGRIMSSCTQISTQPVLIQAVLIDSLLVLLILASQSTSLESA
jgi:hypothetical protein